MGKSKKLGKLGGKVVRPGPLGDQLQSDSIAIPSGRIKIRYVRKDNDDKFLDGQLGKNILKQSVAQLKEMEEVHEPAGVERKPKAAPVSLDEIGAESSDEEFDEDSDVAAPIPQNIDKLCSDFEKEIDVDMADKIFTDFMNKDAVAQRKLADLFKERITEKHTEICTNIDADSARTLSVSPELEEMCGKTGEILSKYRSGTLPKIFKVIPKMRNWEELLYMTNPDKWSAAAMYQATAIFVSNLKSEMAQRFLNLVLFPRVRDDISYYHRLNYHLYQALCKALFKPAAFFKGILLPLCQSGNCSLREAIIVGSVIAKNSIPIIHSAAALLKIAEMDYSGANSIFLRIFFDKKYALPYRVIDSCVHHFIKFRNDKRELPVLWHQSFLVFVQRYKNDLSEEQKEELLQIVKFHTHFKITAEIRREIQNSTNNEEGMEYD